MGLHVVELSIEEEKELYNAFDKRGLTLSSDVISYLIDRYNSKNLTDDMLIRIESKNPVELDKFLKAYSNYIDKEERSLDKKLRINRLKMIRLFFIGIILVVVAILFSRQLGVISAEIISIVGSMAIKDGATIWIENNPETRVQKRLLGRMRDTRIEIA